MKLVHVVGLMICLSILAVLPASAYLYIDSSIVGTNTVKDQPYCIYGVDNLNVTPYTEHGDWGIASKIMSGCSESYSGHINATSYGPYTNGQFSTSPWAAVGDCSCYSSNRTYLNVMLLETDGGGIPDGWLHILTSWKWEDVGFNPATAAPVCSFTATPTSGESPLLVTFTDTSTNTPITWDWTIYNNSTGLPIMYSTVKTWVNYVNGAGTQFDINLTASNVYGSCNIYSPKYLTTTAIGTNTTQYLIIEAKDYLTGALVSDTDFSIKNLNTGVWTNLTASGGIYGFNYPYSTPLYIESIAPGYALSTKSWTVSSFSTYDLWMLMYPGETPAAGNVSLHVVVFDGTTLNPMPNAQVRLSDGQVKTTSGAGVAAFNVSATQSYQIVASYTGYNSATRTFTTGAGGTSQDTYLTLSRMVVTTATTLPPGVTAVTTVDARTNAQKDQEMMDQIRSFGPTLITLAMVMTALYITGYKP